MFDKKTDLFIRLANTLIQPRLTSREVHTKFHENSWNIEVIVLSSCCDFVFDLFSEWAILIP